MTTTPNIGIYIPADGSEAYGQSFAVGMENIDAHDHSGGINKGLPIPSAGLADFSVTYSKLNANVADITTGIGVSGANPNQLQILGLLKNIFQISTSTGFIAKNGSAATANTFAFNANQLLITNPDGASGTPNFSLASTVTNPTQPAFSVFNPGTASFGGGGVATKILFSGTTFDQANSYNHTTDRFVAPVTGVYIINMRLSLNNLVIGNTEIEIFLKINGSNTVTLIRQNPYADSETNTSNQLVLNGTTARLLTANDYVELSMTLQGAAVNVDGGEFQAILCC